MTRLTVPDPDERGDLGAFVARVVRLDQAALVRLQSGAGTVTAWAATPFDALATRTVHGEVEPGDVTMPAAGLLTALTVERAATVDPGTGGLWHGELPPSEGWQQVDDVPAAELERLTERGLALARENAGPMGPPASLLDQTVLTVSAGARPAVKVPQVKVPLRCLFALSGMGFLGDTGPDAGVVRVSATGSWMRLDARYGAIVRRRVTALPLLVG
ncbi:hypothetical protein [Pseudonocardia adelaidensis]|uniref:Uncharacterized protein n=1 Tax=Pseudonocardia adelaidensis TaxID=648754 RepID=A0ABP9NWD4_9PSEU